MQSIILLEILDKFQRKKKKNYKKKWSNFCFYATLDYVEVDREVYTIK